MRRSVSHLYVAQLRHMCTLLCRYFATICDTMRLLEPDGKRLDLAVEGGPVHPQFQRSFGNPHAVALQGSDNALPFNFFLGTVDIGSHIRSMDPVFR